MRELKPCPFCGEAMNVSPHPVDMWAVCPTAGCIGARQIVVLEDAKQVAAWNRRASPPEDVRRETRLEKEVERLRAALAECCAPFDTGPTTVLESASLVASELQRRINIAAEAMQ